LFVYRKGELSDLKGEDAQEEEICDQGVVGRKDERGIGLDSSRYEEERDREREGLKAQYSSPGSFNPLD
jgi:hypothetical protein